MNDPQFCFTAISTIISDSLDWKRPEQLAAFAAVMTLLDELETYARTNDVTERIGAIEKLGDARDHLRSAFGLDGARGHSIDQHFSWARIAITGSRYCITGT